MTQPIKSWTKSFSHVASLLLESWREWELRADGNQLSLAVPTQLDVTHMSYKDQLMHGTGSFKLKNWPYSDRDYTKLVAGFDYIQPVLDYASSQGWVVCRPMLRCLPPKSCLSYHRDDATMRFHIPLDTTWQAFFVVQDQVHRMPEVGTLYSLTTNVLHTAVNANLNKPRIHFTFTAYARESK